MLSWLESEWKQYDANFTSISIKGLIRIDNNEIIELFFEGSWQILKANVLGNWILGKSETNFRS